MRFGGQGRSASTSFESNVSRPAANVEQRLAARELQRRNRGGPPPAIDAGAEEMIEKIVSRRDRIEHSGDAGRRFVGR